MSTEQEELEAVVAELLLSSPHTTEQAGKLMMDAIRTAAREILTLRKRVARFTAMFGLFYCECDKSIAECSLSCPTRRPQ